MKRLAAHYVLLPDDRLLKLHYIELDDDNRLLGVFSLEKEIASAIFYNGILLICHFERSETIHSESAGLLHFPRNDRQRVEIYLLTQINLLPSKFTANDCRSHSYIQRIG
jgi:hypothetical protein